MTIPLAKTMKSLMARRAVEDIPTSGGIAIRVPLSLVSQRVDQLH
jgi:hypothetical protein